MALTTDRISVLRGRPPVRAGGRRGFRTAHCWLVRSLGYGLGFIPFLRSRPPFWNRLLVLEARGNTQPTTELDQARAEPGAYREISPSDPVRWGVDNPAGSYYIR